MRSRVFIGVGAWLLGAVAATTGSLVGPSFSQGQLADEASYRQAVTLASGEAKLRSQVGEMFSTLSRRNTSLINQQLGLIERLEKDEEDPNRLESLFRLAHLGYYDVADLFAVVAALEVVLKQLGHRAELGSGVRAAPAVYLQTDS